MFDHVPFGSRDLDGLNHLKDFANRSCDPSCGLATGRAVPLQAITDCLHNGYDADQWQEYQQGDFHVDGQQDSDSNSGENCGADGIKCPTDGILRKFSIITKTTDGLACRIGNSSCSRSLQDSFQHVASQERTHSEAVENIRKRTAEQHHYARQGRHNQQRNQSPERRVEVRIGG